MKVQGKGLQHTLFFDFQPRKVFYFQIYSVLIFCDGYIFFPQWYMVTAVFVYNRWSRSEIRCSVNGQQVSATDVSWFVNTSEVRDIFVLLLSVRSFLPMCFL